MKIRDIQQTGSVGQYVTYESRYGLIRRQKVIPRNPQTTEQMQWRAAFQRARSFWGTLTDEQWQAWEATGQSRQAQAALGREEPVPGYLVCVSVNARLAMLGQPMVLTPPPVPVFLGSPVAGLVITNTAGTVSIKLQLSGKAGQYVLVSGARPQSPGVRYVDIFPFLGVLPEDAIEETDITALYVARYGVPPAGRRVFIRTVQQINGWQDRPIILSCRVPAPQA